MENQYKYIYHNLESTPLSEIENAPDGIETLLIGKVEDMQIKSGMKNGIFIEEYLATVDLKDAQGLIEFVVLQDKLKKLQKMDLSEEIVFKAIITDFDACGDSIKKIQVLDIININEVVKCKI